MRTPSTKAPRFEIRYIGKDNTGFTEVVRAANYLYGWKTDYVAKNRIKLERDGDNFRLTTNYGHGMIVSEKDLSDIANVCLSMLVENINERENKPKHSPPFRVGKSSSRAVLDAEGHEVVLFPEGSENLAVDYVERLNKDNKPLW